MGKNVVVLGTQWGDEGKGKIVDLLTDQAAAVVRYQGGHNAGHTLVIDGEMQADTALVAELAQQNFPHSKIQGDATVLIFPDLFSANTAYKLVQHLGKADAIGPILLGMRKPVNVMHHNVTVDEIVNLTSITAVASKHM